MINNDFIKLLLILLVMLITLMIINFKEIEASDYFTAVGLTIIILCKDNFGGDKK